MKKYLLGTMALSALVVGCSQEELVPQVSEEVKVQEMNTVVGHDLVGPIAINVGEQTRAANGAWQAGDKFGLAWFDIAGDITAEQKKDAWDATSSSNIYGNHLFSWVEGVFKTQTNVYQGAHFVYFPFEYVSQIGPKTVDLNKKPLAASKDDQQTDDQYDRYNNAFHMSTADFIAKDDAKGLELTKAFYLSPVVNALRIQTTPDGKFKTAQVLKDLQITSYSIEVADKVFEDKFEIVTADIPMAVYEEDENGKLTDELDKEANKAELDKYAITKLEATEKTNKLSREVAANYTMAEMHQMPIYTLPVAGYKSNNKEVEITVNIQTKTGLTGFFTIDNPDGLSEGNANVTTINRLNKAMLDGNDLAKIARNKAGEWAPFNLPVNLSEANFTLTANIASYEQWADAVEIYEALGVETATLTVTDDVKFNETIPTLTNGKIIAKTDGKKGKISITGNVTLPKSGKLDLSTYAPAVEVATTGNLTIADEVKLENDNVVNKGIITLGWKSQIGKRVGTGINNNADPDHVGRINVIYGSYAYLASGQEGIVAYIVPADYELYKLSYLIRTDNENGQASVNTFVVGYDEKEQKLVDLNLNGNDRGEDDPYNNGIDSNMPELDNITIEMTGGVLRKGATTSATAKTNVKAVKVLSGTNEINGVTVLKDIEVEPNATAIVTSGEAKANIINDGTLTLTDVKINMANNTVIDNDGTMTIDATLTGNPLKVTYEASALKLTNSNKFTVTENVLSLQIKDIVNKENGTITAAKQNQVKFSSMDNNGTLVRVTQ